MDTAQAGRPALAEKIDPATHTYSHTKLVASFAGFAPVSSPAISIAVVIDTPTVGSFYGAAGKAAPVFQTRGPAGAGVRGCAPRPAGEDAQKSAAGSQTDVPADGPSENTGDLAMQCSTRSITCRRMTPLRTASNAASDANENHVPAVADTMASAPSPSSPPTGAASRTIANSQSASGESGGCICLQRRERIQTP